MHKKIFISLLVFSLVADTRRVRHRGHSHNSQRHQYANYSNYRCHYSWSRAVSYAG